MSTTYRFPTYSHTGPKFPSSIPKSTSTTRPIRPPTRPAPVAYVLEIPQSPSSSSTTKSKLNFHHQRQQRQQRQQHYRNNNIPMDMNDNNQNNNDENDSFLDDASIRTQHSVTQKLRPCDFNPMYPKCPTCQCSPRTAYMIRRSHLADITMMKSDDDDDDDDDDDIDDIDVDIDSFDHDNNEQAKQRGFKLLNQSDPTYLGFLPSRHDKRPFLNALPLVTKQNHPQLECCPLYMPISYSQRIILFVIIAFVIVAVGALCFFALTVATTGIRQSYEK